jgi:hypothetical protein
VSGDNVLYVLPVNPNGTAGTLSAPLHTVPAGFHVRDIKSDPANFFVAETNDGAAPYGARVYRIPRNASSPGDVALIYDNASNGKFIDRLELTGNKVVFTELADYNYLTLGTLKTLSKSALPAPMETPMLLTSVATNSFFTSYAGGVFYTERSGAGPVFSYQAIGRPDDNPAGVLTLRASNSMWMGSVSRESGMVSSGVFADDASHIFAAEGFADYNDGFFGATFTALGTGSLSGPTAVGGVLSDASYDHGRYAYFSVDQPGVGLGEACTYFSNIRECDIVYVDAAYGIYQRLTRGGPDEGPVQDDRARADEDVGTPTD